MERIPRSNKVLPIPAQRTLVSAVYLALLKLQLERTNSSDLMRGSPLARESRPSSFGGHRPKTNSKPLLPPLAVSTSNPASLILRPPRRDAAESPVPNLEPVLTTSFGGRRSSTPRLFARLPLPVPRALESGSLSLSFVLPAETEVLTSVPRQTPQTRAQSAEAPQIPLS
ncbi:Uncharacterised protein [uncultured archaeon]|nr:Uncharacterised protein [uncultured archaeon]